MTEISLRSDNVDVEQIMRQIRSRIREKRGVDYTEEEIRELANVKLETFLDPRGVRSDLLEQFRRKREASLPPNFAFEDTTLFETHRGFLAFMRRLLRPILKLFFNPNPLIEALHIQSKLNAQQAAIEPLYYEVMHNLVLETTRLGIEVKNLKMRVESMSSRLDFDERRAKALEGVVQYRPGAVAPAQPPAGAPVERPLTEAEQAERRTRRRRRRGRRRPGDGRDGSADAREASRTGFGETSSAAGQRSGSGFGETSSAAGQRSGSGFGETSSADARDGSRAGFGAPAADERSTGGFAETEPATTGERPSPADAREGSRAGFGEASTAAGERSTGGFAETEPQRGGGESHES